MMVNLNYFTLDLLTTIPRRLTMMEVVSRAFRLGRSKSCSDHAEEKMKSNCYKILATALLTSAALSATPFGTMSLGIDVGGGVDVFGTRIDFFLPKNPGAPGNGAFVTGQPTSISYNNGVSNTILDPTTNPAGIISDLDAAPPVPFPPGGIDFLLFTGAPALHFDILDVGPGGAAQNALTTCAAQNPGAVGVRCSPNVIASPGFSPFVLTYNGSTTDVSLTVLLNGRDATGSSLWKASFTTQLNMTPAAAEALLNSPGGVIENTWSFTASSVPEPGTISILGSGILLVGLAAWRRKSRQRI
jgi:PEP-CTERM motif-containing protein